MSIYHLKIETWTTYSKFCRSIPRRVDFWLSVQFLTPLERRRFSFNISKKLTLVAFHCPLNSNKKTQNGLRIRFLYDQKVPHVTFFDVLHLLGKFFSFDYWFSIILKNNICDFSASEIPLQLELSQIDLSEQNNNETHSIKVKNTLYISLVQL